MEAWRSAPDAPKANSRAASVAHSIDPFEQSWALIEQWLNEQPDATAKELLYRLQQTDPTIPDNQLRTLQRRVRAWRTAVARRLVVGAFGAESVAEMEEVTS